MKSIEVVAAIIYDKKRRIFATQRGYGEFKDGWEFPGGKIEKNESKEDALIREIDEELAVKIKVQKHLKTVEYDYPDFHLTMHCYFATIREGDIELKEHEAARWLNIDELYSVDWLPADLLIIEDIEDHLRGDLNTIM